MGKANSSCDRASGGVIIAAKINIAIIVDFRYLLKVSPLIIHSIAAITIRRGICDMMAKAIVMFMKNDV